MDAPAVVEQLADLLGRTKQVNEDAVYLALTQAGIPEAQVDRAYKFTQTAWARFFLKDLGVQFSPEFFCFNAQGDVIESGLLENDPSYQRAMQMAPQYAGTDGFKQMALISSEADAVNQALDNGSQPEDLIMTPALFFMENPTEEGIRKIQKMIEQHLDKIRREENIPTPPPEPRELPPKPRMKVKEGGAKKPWWKFW